MTVSASPTLTEVLTLLRAGILRDLKVCVPARVETFYADTCTVDAKPLIGDIDPNSGEAVSLDVCVSVPVCFPGGGGLRLTFPLAQGDQVLLVFGDRSRDSWQSTGNEALNTDARRHSLADAYAIPGVRPDSNPYGGVESGAVTVGVDLGTLSNFIARADLVNANFHALYELFTGWTPVSGDGGLALRVAFLAMVANLPDGPTWPQNVATSVLKVRE